MKIIIIITICYIMFRSMRHFLLFKELRTIYHETTISFEVYYTLIIVYCIFIIGFGLIYFIVSLEQIILINSPSRIDGQVPIVQQLFQSIYFSGVTLLTIGYGDITPIGIGRVIAIVQALFGYVLPTAFVLKLVQLNYHVKQNK